MLQKFKGYPPAKHFSTATTIPEFEKTIQFAVPFYGQSMVAANE